MNHFKHQKGFTLVELMVSLLLGLVVVGGVISVLVANRNSYRTNEGMSQVQETARTAFELLARDVRQTGGTGCDNARRMGNVLTGYSSAWWTNWASVQGFDGTDGAVTTGTGLAQRVSGTDTLHMHSIEGGGFPINVHSAGAGTMTLNVTGTAPLASGDILLVCDFDHATIFKGDTFTAASNTITYSTGLPGNCSRGLGFPTDCASGAGNSYAFPRNAWVGRLRAVTWYIGNNNRPADGGRSLYRVRLDTNANLVTEEVVSGVSDLQVTYGRNGIDAIVAATSLTTPADWAAVNSVFITVTVNSIDSNVTTTPGTNSGRIQRSFTWLVALRNRVP